MRLRCTRRECFHSRPKRSSWLPTLRSYGELTGLLHEELLSGGLDKALVERDGPFPELWYPWVQLAVDELSGDSSFERQGISEEAWLDLQRLLFDDVFYLSASAAYKSFDDFRAARAEPAGCYREWIDRVLRDPIGAFYGHYPVLARQTTTLLQQWRESTTEFLGRLEENRERLASALGVDGDLVSVGGGVGDRHRDGRSVLLLEFANGKRAVYKPRSLAPELAYRSVVAWLRDKGARAFATRRRVCRA